MAGQTGIQWTDWSWNPSVGCTRVSPGCQSCYAFQLHDQRHKAYLAGRFPGAPAQYHKPFSEVQLLPDRLTLPLRWRKPRRVFVDSMSDLWHAEVPDWFLASVFAVMAATPHITYQILTKRPQRMRRLISDPGLLFADLPDSVFMETFNAARKRGIVDTSATTHLLGTRWPLPNVWLGVSVESQQYAWRIDWLAETPAAVRFLSCEPLIGELDLIRYLVEPYCTEEKPEPWTPRGDLHWIIAGGESGPHHRPIDPDWVRLIRDDCLKAHVPFFFKQWGGRTPKAGGRLLDGRTWDEFPTVQGAHQS